MKDPSAVLEERYCAAALDFAAVLALFERLCESPLGRMRLRLLSPRTSEGVEAAFARIEELRSLEQAGRAIALRGLPDPLLGLANARGFGRALVGEELSDLLRFLSAAEALRSRLHAEKRTAPRCAELLESAPVLKPLRERIEAVVDARGAVRDEASPRLRTLREARDRLAGQVESQLLAMVRNSALRGFLSDGQIHRRFDRAVLAVKTRSAGRVPGIVHDRSHTEQTVFVEPQGVVELGNQLAEARQLERREEALILTELTRELLGEEGSIHEAAMAIGELELAGVSLAFCHRYQARAPKLPQDPMAAEGLLLRGARHPLLCEQALEGRIESVVGLDLRLGEDFAMLVVTGPNTGGKTLALKTVGLAALLTRLGLPFPCDEGSTVPLYGRIFCDIGDEQEVSQNLSTFASHLVRIRAALADAGEGSLVLLDELGGGTDPDEGAALGEAVLEFLHERRVPTIATTHLSRLKEFAFRHSGVENASVAFETQSLRPLYRLVVGTPGESCALAIAGRLGLPEEVVERARARLMRHSAHMQQLLEDLARSREHAERARSQADERLADLAAAERELEQRVAAISLKEERLEGEAQRELEARLREARDVLERAKARLEQLQGEPARVLRAELDLCERLLSGAALSERRRAFLHGLAKGTFVHVPRLGRRLPLTRIDRARREVCVRLGGADVRVSFDELETPSP
jgi:DNA mismatch repair protein MutS2